MDRRHFRLGFAGFGNVGRALARLLLERRGELERRHDLTFEVTLLASARRGALVEPAGADCMPVFNLVEAAVPVGRIVRCRGVLNSTSNHVLQAVSLGRPAREAVAEMQRLGLAEADPSHDLDGWDQAVKIVILANVLMGRDLKPADVERTPLAAVDAAWLRRAEGAGRIVRLGGEVSADGPARVRPGSLGPGHLPA